MPNLSYMNAIRYAVDKGVYHPTAEQVQLETTVYATKEPLYSVKFMCLAMNNIINMEPPDSPLAHDAQAAKHKIQHVVGRNGTLFRFIYDTLKKQYGRDAADMYANPKLFVRYFDIYRNFPEIYEKPESITKYFAPYIYTA